ncbi:hypothetical protein Bca4012_064562 [Brassica carinata]
MLISGQLYEADPIMSVRSSDSRKTGSYNNQNIAYNDKHFKFKKKMTFHKF